MIRRTFLKLMGGLAALVATTKLPPVQASPPIFADGDLRPFWCPKGFLPLQGQTITAAKYPDLFFKAVVDGRNYVPPFFGKSEARLSMDKLYIPTEFEKAGYWDADVRLTRLPPKSPDWDKFEIKLISTEHMRWPNGRPIRAGFMSSMTVARSLFEEAYGPVREKSKNKDFGLAPFQYIDDYDRSGTA